MALTSRSDADKNDMFIDSMKALQSYCEGNPKQQFNTLDLSLQLGFHRRRFYDIINVLDAAGVCCKHNSETISWVGIQNVRPHIMELAIKNRVFDPKASFRDIIPREVPLSILKVTEYLFLAFLSLQVQYIDIKKFAWFLSRNDGKTKTTLCKLYHIIHILQTSNIVTRTGKPGEAFLTDSYFIQITESLNESINDFSICNLLAKGNPHSVHPCVLRRRAEYEKELEEMVGEEEN